MTSPPPADIVGEWSECKLQILDAYLKRYCFIMQRQPTKFTLHYVDAFANIGHLRPRRNATELIEGSVRIALRHPFHRFWLIEEDRDRAAWLRKIASDSRGKSISVLEGDANRILPERILPSIRYDRFERGFVLVDPYKLNVLVGTVDALAANRAVECLLNLPIMDTNRRVLPRETTVAALDTYMRTIADVDIIDELYAVQLNFAGENQLVRGRLQPERLAALYQRWLKAHGFTHVSSLLVMRNSVNAPLYALVYAGHNPAGARIISWLLARTQQPWVGRAVSTGSARSDAQPTLFD